jgi:hypothetical protein
MCKGHGSTPLAGGDHGCVAGALISKHLIMPVRRSEERCSALYALCWKSETAMRALRLWLALSRQTTRKVRSRR